MKGLRQTGGAGKPTGLVQGTLDMLILKTLALEPMHGYGIGVRIEQISQGVFQVNAGSLFPAFRRLERDGLIKGEWRETENNRRLRQIVHPDLALLDVGTGLAVPQPPGTWTSLASISVPTRPAARCAHSCRPSTRAARGTGPLE
jgi:PadR family transcriptional regulator, regulatory protein PadR